MPSYEQTKRPDSRPGDLVVNSKFGNLSQKGNIFKAASPQKFVTPDLAPGMQQERKNIIHSDHNGRNLLQG